MKRTHLKLVKPRNFTTAEAVLDAVREGIFVDGRPYKLIAAATGVSATTIYNIASGRTAWPRHTTLFPLMQALGMRMEIMQPEKEGLH